MFRIVAIVVFGVYALAFVAVVLAHFVGPDTGAADGGATREPSQVESVEPARAIEARDHPEPTAAEPVGGD